MKAYRLICNFSKNEDKGEIEYIEGSKHEGAPEEDVKQVLELCISSIKNHYSNYSEGYNGYFSEFTFTKLNSGSFCIYKLEGKEDHYTSCILIIENGYLPFYPIQLFGSEVLSIENNKGLNISFFGGLSGKLKPVEGISFEKNSAFLKGKGDNSLRSMLDILFDTYENPVLIKVQDKLDNLVLWIAALQMAFPIEMAHSIFFTIESSNSDLAASIITTWENGFKKLEMAEDKEVYSFNFIMGRTSRAINEFRLTRLIEMGYIISPETLNAFHKFLNKFNYKMVDNGLEKCYKLFNMINFGLGNAEDEELEGALEFVKLYGPQAVLEELFEGFQNILTKIDYEINMEKVKMLSDFMFEVGVKSKERIYLDRASDFFFRFMDMLIMKLNTIDSEDLLEFYEDIKKIASRHVDRIIKYSISAVRLKQIGEYLGENNNPQKSAFYVQMILGDLIRVKYSWNKAMYIDGFGEFISASIQGVSINGEDYEAIFNTISMDVDYFSHFSVLLYNNLISKGAAMDFVACFSKCISEKTEDFADEAHGEIFEIDMNTRLIFEEFIFNLKDKPNKSEYFWSSFKYGQKDIPGHMKNYTGEAVKIYFSLLDEKDFPVESRKLIRFIVDKDITTDKETLRYIIKEYENTLQLIEPAEEELMLIQSIDRIKYEKNISTMPDVTGLILFAMNISNPGGGHRLKLNEILENYPDFKRIDSRYIQYLQWCLPHIIEYLEVSEDHKQIIDLFCIEGMEEEFFNFYIEIIEKRCQQNKSSGYSKVLNFLLSYYYYFLPKYVYMEEEHLIESMNEKISELLEGDYIRNINDLDKDLTYEFQKRELSVPIMWKEIYMKSREKRGNPLFNQVKRMFSKK